MVENENATNICAICCKNQRTYLNFYSSFLIPLWSFSTKKITKTRLLAFDEEKIVTSLKLHFLLDYKAMHCAVVPKTT